MHESLSMNLEIIIYGEIQVYVRILYFVFVIRNKEISY